MRILVIAGFVFLGLGLVADAQEQEKKLLDRILKPDTSLQNSAQNKQFAASGGILTRIAHTKPFFVSRAAWEKRYSGTKQFEAKEFTTHQSRFAQQTANTSSRNRLTKIDTPVSTTAYVTRASVDSGKTAPSADYAGARPFLVQGKSQKSLSAQDRTMTIDEVRELLNKNK